MCLKKEFIDIFNFIKSTYELGLKKYIESDGCLCELSIDFFDNVNRPDYSKLPVQQSYLLKYSLAYAFEYFSMYNAIASFLEGRNYINILSIGCGSCIDYWALCYLLYEYNIELQINYIGVDQIKWYANDIENNFNNENLDKFNKRNKDNCYFIKSSIDEIFNNINNNDISNLLKKLNIIIFPRSIDEIYSDECSTNVVKNIIRNINNRCYILASTYNARSFDILEELKYFVYSKPIYNSPFERTGIYSINKDFRYPDSVKNEYINLCKHKDKENGICILNNSNKICHINENPILYADKIKYGYFYISKESNDNKC